MSQRKKCEYSKYDSHWLEDDGVSPLIGGMMPTPLTPEVDFETGSLGS